MPNGAGPSYRELGGFETGSREVRARSAEVWRKGGIRLEASNSHLGFFRENLIALRAETRVALTVYDGAAFSVANLAS